MVAMQIPPEESGDLKPALKWVKYRFFVLGPVLSVAATAITILVADHFLLRETAVQAAELKNDIDQQRQIQMALFVNVALLCQQNKGVACVTLQDVESGRFKLEVGDKK